MTAHALMPQCVKYSNPSVPQTRKGVEAASLRNFSGIVRVREGGSVGGFRDSRRNSDALRDRAVRLGSLRLTLTSLSSIANKALVTRVAKGD